MDQYEIQIGENRSLTVARVMPDAHWHWLAKGWVDFKATWRFGLLIGIVPVLSAWVMVFGLWYLDMLGFIPAVCGGFALVGPILALGCYQLSRSHEAREAIELNTLLKPRIISPGQVSIIGFVLMLILVIWARLASLLYALASSARQPAPAIDFINFALQTPEGLTMVVVGTLIGAALAAMAYVVSVIAIPLTFDRQVDALTAMLVSVVAVLRNKGAMISFAFNIAMLVGLCLITGFIGLIIVFPWLGYATWHCYRTLITHIDTSESH
ncbi:DUF2189 domain-containing protein [Candidatus Phycosocius spiralis]|uniref:DUF2189 domain-containing protein n=1 Tax=Candidatus Phycosocius spiralis TaxID=2815099 RepID=A0ABQ4PU98_9PROT|nr:DUF2189 domain-containing protein [Candidatus Phycosocius spiralis]GIU66559.1 hypothetical protein PsB1_0713 [Candidatus Phycosocius spiralis]